MESPTSGSNFYVVQLGVFPGHVVAELIVYVWSCFTLAKQYAARIVSAM